MSDQKVLELDYTKTTTSDKKDGKLKQMVGAELKKLMQQSKQLQDQIGTAKTTYAKKYYNKKLKKNNKKAMEMVVALSKL